jgi:cell division protein FtsQ
LKKVLDIGLWIVLGLVFIILWGFTSAKQSTSLCTDLKITIDLKEGNSFISEEDIEVYLRTHNVHPKGKQWQEIDLLSLEEKLETIPEVKKAAVYKNLNGRLRVDITQRNPIVRVMNANGTQFYLDEEGYQMPLSEHYTPRVPVVTGYINDPYTRYSATEIAKNETLAETVKSDEVFQLVSWLRKNPYWNAQVQQINFNLYNEIELVPTLGDHIIELGTLENFDRKLNKLKIFYTEGLNHADWNAYDTINIKFKDQIICTKK